MTIKVSFDKDKGLQQESVSDGGEGVQIGGNKADSGFSPMRLSTAAHTTDVTLAAHETGVHTFQAAGVSRLAATMPLASSCPGGMFVFRTLSAAAHYLTCSQETNGTLAFCDTSASGSNLSFPGYAVGESLILQCDGIHYVVLGASGSYAISGT